jgi:hypothetical protein
MEFARRHLRVLKRHLRVLRAICGYFSRGSTYRPLSFSLLIGTHNWKTVPASTRIPALDFLSPKRRCHILGYEPEMEACYEGFL